MREEFPSRCGFCAYCARCERKCLRDVAVELMAMLTVSTVDALIAVEPVLELQNRSKNGKAQWSKKNNTKSVCDDDSEPTAMSGQHREVPAVWPKTVCQGRLQVRVVRRCSSVVLLAPSLGLDHDSFWLGLASERELDAGIRHAKPSREQYGVSSPCSWTSLTPCVPGCPHSLT